MSGDCSSTKLRKDIFAAQMYIFFWNFRVTICLLFLYFCYGIRYV